MPGEKERAGRAGQPVQAFRRWLEPGRDHGCINSESGPLNPVKRRLALASLAMLVAAAPVHAADKAALDLPAGSLGDAIAALAKQTGASVSVVDGSIWTMRVPAIKGRMGAEEALRRLLRGSRSKLISIAGNSFRIVAAPQEMARRNAPPPPTLPYDLDGVEDEPIIVTASKRETRLKEFAGSVSLLNGLDLTFGGEQGMESILARVASLSSTHLGAGRNKLFIRGIADSSFTGPTQATVGQYLGDMRLTYNAPDPDLRLYDIQSVEILEGPQGTLYGAGSLGGVIRIVRNPAALGKTEAALTAGLSATQHGDPGGDIGAMINLPVLGDRVALRAVGFGIREGGYIDDVLRQKSDINRTTIAGGRSTLKVDLGDDWAVDLSSVFQTNDGADSQYADRILGGLNRASRSDGGFASSYLLGDMVIAKKWDGVAFLSSTGGVRQRLKERYDASLAGGAVRQFVQRNLTRMFVTENRLWRPMHRRYGWLLGASHTRNRTNIDRFYRQGTATTSVPGVINQVHETTLYGEVSVEPLRGLIVTGGARQTWSNLTGGADDPTPIGPAFSARLAALLAQARAEIVKGRVEKRLLPSGSVSVSPVKGLIVYARYQEGFRPGGLAIEGGFVRRFRNDGVKTIEAGARFGERDRDPFNASLSLSYTEWGNIQADFIDAAGLPSTDNIGDGRIYSLSFELHAEPAPDLSFDIATTFNDSKVIDPTATLINNSARPGRQNRIPNVARFTTRFGADYRKDLGDDLELRVGGWARYVGKSRLGIGPILGDLQGDYFDTALTARVGRPNLGVTLGITNITDSIGNRFALGTPFTATTGGQITPMRPRTVRIGVDSTF
jgi:outer membrane receptor protein involved in Fe transport